MRAKRSTYPEIERALKSCKPFSGNSMSAVGSPDAPGGYQVYSYLTCIARVTRGENGRLSRTISPDRFGKTTTRALNLARKHLCGENASVTMSPTLKTF